MKRSSLAAAFCIACLCLVYVLAAQAATQPRRPNQTLPPLPPTATRTPTATPTPVTGQSAKVRIIRGFDGYAPKGHSVRPSLSGNAEWLAFESSATNLVPGVDQRQQRIYLYHLPTNQVDVAHLVAPDAGSRSASSPFLDYAGRYLSHAFYASNHLSASNLGLYDRVASASTYWPASSPGDLFKHHTSISPDGRYQIFVSRRNPITGVTESKWQVYTRDYVAGTFALISATPGGLPGGQDSGISAEYDKPPVASYDGRFVAFHSAATNLVPGDTNGWLDVFVRDTQTNQTTRVSVSSTGEQAGGHSAGPSISYDGRYVAFHSAAPNLVPGDTNNNWDVFVHDRQTGETTRVSVSSAGIQAGGESSYPAVSGDGRFVAFHSTASMLMSYGGGGALYQIYLHDRQTGETNRISVSPKYDDADGDAYYPTISADGRYIAYQSASSNLAPGGKSGTFAIYIFDRLAPFEGPPPYDDTLPVAPILHLPIIKK